MELGNALFGCSRGEFELPREFETPLCYLAQRIENRGMFETDNMEYVSDLFEMHPYYWGDCTCGFDDKVGEWEETHHHTKDCYQNLVKDYILNNHKDLFYFDKDTDNYRPYVIASYDKYTKVENSVQEKFCKELGLTYPEGRVVHCTCNFDKDYQEWISKNSHYPECPIVRPNFWYKPMNVRVMWYKHIGLDSYINKELRLKQFLKIIDECIASL